MQLKGMKWFARLLVMVLVVSLVAVPVTEIQAAPDDGVYDIAVLKVGGVFEWGGWRHWTDDDFTQLTVEPGIENYTWNTIPTTALTATGLAPYDVLIVPHTHGYDWLDQAKKQAIVDWVNGGKLLIVHSYYDMSQPELINDPLMAAFGEDYRVDWIGQRYGGWPSDNPWIADADNPLVSTPNTLTGGQTGDLGSWQRGVQNTIDPATAGSSWNWAASTSYEGRTVHWLGYALSESGAIVVSGGNPEQHSTDPYQGSDRIREGARKLIENEITLELPVTEVEVEIDIKPGSFPNSINPDSKGIIPVAILTTDAFDAATVNATTVTFGPSAATMVHKKAHLEDVDDDGDTDMLLHFRTRDTGIEAGDTEAGLTGLTFDGQEIYGVDLIRIVGKEDG